MTRRPPLRRAGVTAAGALWLLGSAAPAAQAHPLGNFSVNHYTGLTVHADRLDVLAVTDTAEIPTLQAAPAVDTDGDGTASEAERAAWAAAHCGERAARLTVTTPRHLTWTVGSAAFDYQDGQAGLRTSRLTCRLGAPLNLAAGPVTVRVDTGTDATRVGWNEITAKGEGAHLEHSTVPASSPPTNCGTTRANSSTPRGETARPDSPPSPGTVPPTPRVPRVQARRAADSPRGWRPCPVTSPHSPAPSG